MFIFFKAEHAISKCQDVGIVCKIWMIKVSSDGFFFFPSFSISLTVNISCITITVCTESSKLKNILGEKGGPGVYLKFSVK